VEGGVLPGKEKRGKSALFLVDGGKPGSPFPIRAAGEDRPDHIREGKRGDCSLKEREGSTNITADRRQRRRGSPLTNLAEGGGSSLSFKKGGGKHVNGLLLQARK